MPNSSDVVSQVIDPSYNLAVGSLALGSIFGIPGSPLKSKVGAFAAGIPLALFGLFLAFQTTTLRFTFDDSNFSLVKVSCQPCCLPFLHTSLDIAATCTAVSSIVRFIFL